MKLRAEIAHRNPPFAGGQCAASSAFPAATTPSGLADSTHPPCFSPHTKSRREILGSRSRFALSTVAPGQNSGGTPYRQLYPAYPLAGHQCALFRRARSPRAKGSAGTFQRGKFPDQRSIRQRISQKPNRQAPHRCGKLTVYNKLGLTRGTKLL